jgi:hypothetical protein
MDPIPIFKNTQRVITLGWRTVASSIKDARHINATLSTLVHLLYPSYDEYQKETKGSPAIRLLSGAPVIKLKFANLIQNAETEEGLLGTLGGFTHAPSVQDGFFTMADPEEPGYLVSHPARPGDMGPEDGFLYPKVMDFSCTFYPLHSHTLGVYGGPSVAMSENEMKKGKTQEEIIDEKLGGKAGKAKKAKVGARGMPYAWQFPYGNTRLWETPEPPREPNPESTPKAGSDALKKMNNVDQDSMTN